MNDNEIIKALEWLIFNFPKIEKPKDDADKMCNCINLYCQNALDLISQKEAEIERLNEKIKYLYDELERVALMTVATDRKNGEAIKKNDFKEK